MSGYAPTLIVMSGPCFLTVHTRQVLKSLVVAYLSPDTAENQELRQCLAYFFPVYCYSSSENQKRMRQVPSTRL